MSRPPLIRDYPQEATMPLKLKAILGRMNRTYAEFGGAITQTAGYTRGRPLSETAARELVVHNKWPSLTPRHEIRAQTEAYLRDAGLPESDIEQAFDVVEESDVPPAAASPAPTPEYEPIETEMLTPAAKKHFNLFRDPFTDDVQSPDDVFLAGDQRYIREVLIQTAKHGGIVAIVGESGSGKSTLRRDLIDRIQREQLPILAIQPQVIDKTQLTASAICHAIIDDLQPGHKVPRTLEAQGRLVKQMLTESSRDGNAHVLLIEEAHDLNIQTLKYLKRFWELEDGFKKLLAIILIGQPELKATLNEKSRAGQQAREVIRRMEVAELMPLDGELENYLRLKFKRVGTDLGAIFDAQAFDAMRARMTHLGGVYPLSTNNLVRRAMNAAADLGEPRVTADLIKEL